MEHFSKYNKPNKKIIYEYLIPIAIQIVIFLILVFMHRVVKLGDNIQNPEVVNGSISSPTVGRLVYLIINPFLIATAIFFALRFNKKEKHIYTFICANVAGILLWQFLGEDFWHFSVGGIHFLTLETIEALPLVFVLIACLAFFALKKEKNWALWLILVVFSYNWLGHYLVEGFYPLVANSLPFYMWAIIISITICVPSSLFSIYLGVYASKDVKGHHLSSILTFATISILVMSIIHS